MRCVVPGSPWLQTGLHLAFPDLIFSGRFYSPSYSVGLSLAQQSERLLSSFVGKVVKIHKFTQPGDWDCGSPSYSFLSLKYSFPALQKMRLLVRKLWYPGEKSLFLNQEGRLKKSRTVSIANIRLIENSEFTLKCNKNKKDGICYLDYSLT